MLKISSLVGAASKKPKPTVESQPEERTLVACCSSTPQLTTGGRKPKPKKLSDVSARIMAGMASVIEAMGFW